MSYEAIRYYKGKLQVRYDCCNWETIVDLVAVIESVIGGQSTILDAVTSGLIGGVSVPGATPIQARHTTATTIRCVKATAMKHVLKTYMTDLRNYIDEATTDLAELLLGLAAVVYLSPFGKLITMKMLSPIFKEFGKDQVLAAIDAALANDELWNNMVCHLSGRLGGTELVSGLDVQEFYTMAVTGTVQFSAEMLKLITSMNATQFQTHIAEAMAYVGCDCPQYLPYGYQP